jgi:hypothetical protein
LVDVLADGGVEWGGVMKEELAKLHAALREMERASVFRKALVAEEALLAAVVLLEQMVEEIEKLKGNKEGTDKPPHADRTGSSLH